MFLLNNVLRNSKTLCQFITNKNVKISKRFASSYRGAVLTEYGKDLEIQDFNRKRLKDKEVRIEIHCCGVNASDHMMVENKYDHSITLPFIPGFEICGEVIEVGEDVKTFSPGMRILGLNKDKLGGFAEESVLHQDDLWPIDMSVSFERGSSLAENYATALLGLNRRANINEKQTILVTAAAGGLGLAAVDLAANVYKAKVIGVCGTEDKTNLVREKGAWAAVKYTPKHMSQKVREVTQGRGVDVVFDAVGGEVFENALSCVCHEGRVIVAGFASRTVPKIETSALLPKALELVGVSLSHYRANNKQVYRQSIKDVIDMHEEGLIAPHVSAIYSLEKTADAFQFIRERKSTGKVVLEIR